MCNSATHTIPEVKLEVPCIVAAVEEGVIVATSEVVWTTNRTKYVFPWHQNGIRTIIKFLFQSVYPHPEWSRKVQLRQVQLPHWFWPEWARRTWLKASGCSGWRSPAPVWLSLSGAATFWTVCLQGRTLCSWCCNFAARRFWDQPSEARVKKGRTLSENIKCSTMFCVFLIDIFLSVNHSFHFFENVFHSVHKWTFANCDFTFQVTLMLWEVKASSCMSRGGPSGAEG